MRQDLALALMRASVNRDWPQVKIVMAQAAANERYAKPGKASPYADAIDRMVDDAVRNGMADEDAAFMKMLPMDGKDPLTELRVARRTFADLTLDDSVAHLLNTVVAEHGSAETLREHGFTPVSRLLFAGPPGTGKTAAAEALATELERPFVVARIDSTVDSFLGGTARNLRRIFDFIENAPPCVVCLDEFDALASDRNSGGRGNADGEIKRTTNALLQMLDSYSSDTILIATTNLDTVLDQALWRRFDEAAVFTRPTPDQAWAYARKAMSHHTAQGPADAQRSLWIGMIGQFSYADIERVVKRAAKRMVFGDVDMNSAMRDAVAHETRRPEFARTAAELS